MARLPTPGSDNNTWGDILNDFLSVEHNSDGTLKDSGTIATKADDADVVHNSGAETITGTKTFSASPVIPTPTAPGHAVTKAYVDSAGGVPATRAINTGTGLTGGGDLSADRTLSVVFGATGTTVAAGNHTHTAGLVLPAYSKQGVLAVSTGTLRFPIDGTYTIVGTRLMAGTAPTGSSLIIDVNKNGTTVYTNQANRPAIAAGANAGGPGTAPDVTALAAGDYLTIDIDQIGSTVAGADLTVAIVVSRTI